MTKREKQDLARKEFVNNFFDPSIIFSNFNNRELIIRTENPDFPYVHISVAAWTKNDVCPDNQ